MVGLVIFDFDGTIADTMGALTDKAEQVLSTAGLGMQPKAARERYLATSGIPFADQFDSIHPDAPRSLRSAALASFEQHKLAGLSRAGLVIGIDTTLVTLRRNYWDTAIVSSTDKELVQWWLRRNHIDGLIDTVLGHGIDGSKDEQLDTILNEEHIGPILFVGDSVSDYTRARDRALGFIGVSGIVASEFMWRSLSVECTGDTTYVSDIVKRLYGEQENHDV